MPPKLDPIRKHACTYEHCSNSFDTIAGMKAHKHASPDHFYCKKCDLDCADWEDLTQHKVDAMLPFLEGGGSTKQPDKSPKHIVCEFCGDDFKSFGGRKRHREMMHQADQCITCPGCNALFVRAANAVAHLERGQCPAISARQFHANIQHKYLQKDALKQPDVWVQNLSRNKTLVTGNEKPGLITDGFETEDQEEGGVLISANDGDGQGLRSTQADACRPNDNHTIMPLTRENLETWPRLTAQSEARLLGRMQEMSISETAQFKKDKHAPSSDVTGGVKIYGEDYPSLTSAQQSLHGNNDAKSASTITAAQSQSQAQPWTSGHTSAALFKNAPRTSTHAILQSAPEEIAASTVGNGLHTTRWWDRASDDYSPEIFFDTDSQKYACPWPGCGADPYDCVRDFEDHITEIHLKVRFQCPSCLKRFERASGLVAHAEAHGNCRIQKSKHFKQMLDEITGGCLEVQRLPEVKLYQQDSSLVVVGEQQADGVMKARYSAKMPDAPSRW